MDSLEEYLRENKPAKVFRPLAQYIPEGDCLVFYFKPDPSYAERLDDLLTIFRSQETGETTGCKLKGIKCILKRLEDYGMLSGKKSVDVRIMFGGYGLCALERNQVAIEELRKAAEEADAHVEAEELIPA